MSRIRKMKGFTLIELIVVVIIIGILAAIAAVSYNQFVAKSRSAALKATAKQVSTLINAEVASTGKAVTVAVDATDDNLLLVGGQKVKVDEGMNLGLDDETTPTAVTLATEAGDHNCTISIPGLASDTSEVDCN